MFFTLQSEWISQRTSKKASHPPCLCSVPNALRGSPWLRALSPAEQKKPHQGQLCLPLLLLHHSSLQCPDSGHTGLLDVALLRPAASLCTCSTHGRKIPFHSLTPPCPSELRRAFPESLTGSSEPMICFPSSSSPSLVAYMPHKARENCWIWSPLYLPPGPTAAWHTGLNQYLLNTLVQMRQMQELSDRATGPFLDTQGMTSANPWAILPSGGVRWSGWYGALWVLILQSQRRRDASAYQPSLQDDPLYIFPLHHSALCPPLPSCPGG